MKDSAARWKTLLAIDHDPKACEVYRANIPIEPGLVLCRETCDLVGQLPKADVILGGPPCQPFSHAGKRAGSADARDCVPDFVAAVEAGRPRMFLMEQVPGFGTFEDGRYMQRTVTALRLLGYVVDARMLEAVDFGVPQFRMRWWFWGIRSDLIDVHHRWPRPSHVWPWPKQACMFGGDLTPAVVVGQALELDGWIKRPRQTGAREIVGTDEPMQSLSSTRTDENYFIRRARGAGVDRRDHPAAEPCPTIGDGSGGSGGILRMIQSHADPARPVDEPASTLRSGGAGHDGCRVDIHEYRWSDAMLEKHPPASPASPAPTVQAKWFKGGAEGLLTISSKQKRTTRSVAEPAGTLAGDSRHALSVRRLTPAECARLQSLPDGFVWPGSVAKTHRYRIIGNGWASLMAKRMGEALAAADPLSRTLVDLFCGGGCGAVGWHGNAWEYQALSRDGD